MNEVDSLVEGPNPDINSIGVQPRKMSWKVIGFAVFCILLFVIAIVLALRMLGHKAVSLVEPQKKEVVEPPPPKGAASFAAEPFTAQGADVGPQVGISKSNGKMCEDSVLIDKNTGRPVKDANGTSIMVNCQGVVIGAKIPAPQNTGGSAQPKFDGGQTKTLDRYSGDISLSGGSSNGSTQAMGVKGLGEFGLPGGFPAPPTDSTKTIMDQLQRLQNPSQTNGTALQGGGQQQGASANAQGPVGNNLSGANTPKAIATKTIDENRVISKGAQIDCALTTRVVTDISGFASCIVTSNVYSANGRTLLVERMSEVQGEYGASGQPGQRRVFVLWTRIRMPGGVTIDLNSPSTDSLGAAGMDGLLDNRWWERIGSAYMLSFYKDIMAYEIAKNTNSNTSGGATVLQNTTQTSSGLAEKVLAQSINIKPTLYANQGDRVAIYVARDLEFKEVYDVVKSKREQ